mgnify:CR=1 FL=1
MDIGKERWLALGEAMGWVQGDAPAVPQPGIAIADRAALDAALAEAQGGEIFRLADAEFGALEIKRQWDDPVTIIGGTFGSADGGTFGGRATLARGAVRRWFGRLRRFAGGAFRMFWHGMSFARMRSVRQGERLVRFDR